jgi:hypothetical protein
MHWLNSLLRSDFDYSRENAGRCCREMAQRNGSESHKLRMIPRCVCICVCLCVVVSVCVFTKQMVGGRTQTPRSCTMFGCRHCRSRAASLKKFLTVDRSIEGQYSTLAATFSPFNSALYLCREHLSQSEATAAEGAGTGSLAGTREPNRPSRASQFSTCQAKGIRS